MHVAVIIVGFCNAPDIITCLAALERSTYPNFEVVICENGGADSFAALVQALPLRLASGQAVRAIEAPGNVGYAGGVNIGMRAAHNADAWWVLNPDTLADPEALEALVERLSLGDCHAVGGTQYGADGRVQSDGGGWRAWLARPVSIGHGRHLSDRIDPNAIEQRLGFISGASLLVGRGMVDRIGLMREDYFLYAEEVEYCVRARKAGLKLGFAPGARVLHHQGASTGSAQGVRQRPRLPIFLDERNKMLVVRDTAPLLLITAAPAAFAILTLRFLARGAFKQFGYAVAGWKDGLLNRRGVPGWLQ